MAALRIFARSKLSAILRFSAALEHPATSASPSVLQIQKRWGRFNSSPIYKDPSHYTDFEISRNPEEWKYVLRVLKPPIIPKPVTTNERLPSGWKPPTAKPGDYPYYIERTKNYMIPVYLIIKHRGMQKITKVHRIQGDIWKLEADLKEYLERETGIPVGVRIDELAGDIRFRGDYVSLIKAWLEEKGF